MADIVLVPIILILFFLLLLAGLYIHSVLLGVGVIGLLLIDQGNLLNGLLGSDPFNSIANYTLTTIPLFVLMAQFVLNAGIVKDLFTIVYNISIGRKGTLGALTLVVGGLLGAVSGSGTATSASMGQVAVPELRNYGYNQNLAGAVAAAAGSLSGIIPPSLILILFGVFSETPIGDLFMGAIIPGIIMTLCFMIAMVFLLNRTTPPERKKEKIKFTRREITKRAIITSLGASLFIAFVIFGGIYSGFVTPTEAAALGAFGGFIAAIILGKVNKEFMINSIRETVNVTGMVIIIFIGAKILSRFVSVSLLPRKLVESLGSLIEYPITILIIISLVYFILFMFIEGGAVILMTLPVLLPIIEMIDINLIWFGVFVGVLCTLGLLTPPVGLSVFAVGGVTRIPLDGIFKYSLVFAGFSGLVLIVLMVVFPQLVLWLPNTM
ncbi:TRAP transporter large permease [Oceanobacillus longus]|uniref:TRAP transporter large permease n=1 Tax=Oceanobacillus longus TaxID=930120 RepID=A0ABV8GYR2_9BACI